MTMPGIKADADELLDQRRVPWLVLALILAVFALAIAQVTQRMRRDARQLILNRDAEVMRAMVRAQFDAVASEIQMEVRETVDQWTVLLTASRARGVLAARLFANDGDCMHTMPLDVTEGVLSEEDRLAVLASRTVTRYREAVPRGELYLSSDLDESAGNTLPLIEVTLPLQARVDGEVVGIGQFVLEGRTIAREFAALDKSLFAQAAVVFLAGAILIGVSVGWAFRRLRLKHHQLAERTRDLLRANEELAMAARTSAIGSVAAHLIHGLKNPLSGLYQFVQGQTTVPVNGAAGDWHDAVASTRRMQQMVNEVVRVLREEGGAGSYEFSLAELAGLARQRAEPLLRDTGASLHVVCAGEAMLDNRRANLLGLILGNLLQNAAQAAPRHSIVTLELRQSGRQLALRVADQGPGLPERVREHLFAPCQSTREGGTGIGLAISKQLAHHLGADLRLESSSAAGTVFVVEMPLRPAVAKSPLDETVLRS